MSLPVLIGFAGVLVAAVTTGMLAGRCARQPRIGFILWTAATLGLTIALAAQSMGFASGFGPVTFRAVQLFALLLAPLWLAWGLVEVAVPSDAARFGMRLISAALTVVASVILATDPLGGPPFSKAWPLTGLHFQPIALYALDVVQVVAVLAVAAAVVVAVARRPGPPPQAARSAPPPQAARSAPPPQAARSAPPPQAARSAPPPQAARSAQLVVAVVSVGLAVLITAGQRFALPARAAYPLLSMAAAALVWFGVSRVGELPAAAGRAGNRRGLQDVQDDDDRDRPGDDFWPDRSSGGYLPGEPYPTYGHRGSRPGPGGRAPGGFPVGGPVPGGGPAPAGGPVPASGGDRARLPGPPPRTPERPDRFRGSGPGGLAAGERVPGTAAGAPGDYATAAEFTPSPVAGSPAAPPARPYGRILIFTLLDDRAAEFDRLAEEAAEQVRTAEPDTLVYVIHLVPNAPMQRIFYEIYRDRAAFDSHESQPYMQRFVTERRSCVLATNVIELRLKYAKVAPLPGPQAAAPPPAQPPRRLPPPPARLPRYDERYEQRRVPSGRPYSG
jgi:quinol monooxygenase YgiN